MTILRNASSNRVVPTRRKPPGTPTDIYSSFYFPGRLSIKEPADFTWRPYLALMTGLIDFKRTFMQRYWRAGQIPLHAAD